MDTIFEIKIKSLEVAIDRQALRILHNGSQVFKISHIEIKSLALLVINSDLLRSPGSRADLR